MMCKINCSGGCPECAPDEHTSLGQLIDSICPERGAYEFIISTHDWSFDSAIDHVREILKKYNCQINISFNSNELNGITVHFESYVLHHRHYRCRNWGYQYDALEKLCKEFMVIVYSQSEYGYEFNQSTYVTREWQAEGAE